MGRKELEHRHRQGTRETILPCLTSRHKGGDGAEEALIDKEHENRGAVHQLGGDQLALRPEGLVAVVAGARLPSHADLGALRPLECTVRSDGGSTLHHFKHGRLHEERDLGPENLLALNSLAPKQHLIRRVFREMKAFHPDGRQGHAVVDDEDRKSVV